MRIWTIILIVSSVSCGQITQKNNSVDNDVEVAEISDNEIVEMISFDLDNDGKTDRISLKNQPIGDPGEFMTIEINLASGQSFKHNYEEAWDTVDAYATRGLKNKISSERVFCIADNGQNYLFLFGFQYGCCTKQLTIISTVDTSVKTIFDQDLDVTEIVDLNNDGTLDIIGRESTSEIYKLSDSLNAQIGTYAPFIIFSLTTKPTLQKKLTKKFNEDNYVFAGFEYDENIEVAYPKKGYDFKPFIIGRK